MTEIKVKVGKSPDSEPSDKSKIGEGKKPEQRDDVEAQARYWDAVACPNCWAINEVIVDTNVWLGYRCWNCRYYFEV